MKFLSLLIALFKPKWEHPLASVRRIAVKEITDENILIAMVRNDEDPFVRLDAALRITDKEALKDIALNNEHSGPREIAVSKLTDQKILAEVVIKDTDMKVRQVALLKVGDQKIPEEAATEIALYRFCGIGAREKAVEYIFDQEVLNKLAIGHEGRGCKAAVIKVTDQETLGKVARNDISDECRLAAVQKLTDQGILSDLAFIRGYETQNVALGADLKTRAVSKVGWAIIAKLKNQQVLEELARNDGNVAIRFLATCKLTDEDVLEDLAINQYHHVVRWAAIGRLTNQQLLIKIAKTWRKKDERSPDGPPFDADYNKHIKINEQIEAVKRILDKNALSALAQYGGIQMQEAARARLKVLENK